MKVLIALAAVAGLSGCAVYDAPYGSTAYYGSPAPYYGPSYYGGAYYGSAPYFIDRRPIFIQGHRHHGHRDGRGHRWGRGDRDGIPNRFDRDRNNDGVPDRDAHPRRHKRP